jgi:hypothetical protein
MHNLNDIVNGSVHNLLNEFEACDKYWFASHTQFNRLCNETMFSVFILLILLAHSYSGPTQFTFLIIYRANCS